MSTAYLNAVKAVDGYLGQILDMVTNSPTLSGRTTVILTSDHGGNGTAHSTATAPLNYTVPLFAWGIDVMAGGDLYALNPTSRLAPGTGRPDNTATPQPIRNGELANLATQLLGLGVVDGSLFNSGHDLALWSGSADTTPPTVDSFTPADNASGVGVTAHLAINFSESVQKGTGNIVLKKSSDDSVVETMAVASTRVTISADRVTIDPASNLLANTGYYVQVAGGAFKDLSNNAYAGINDTTTWSFTTAAGSVLFSDPFPATTFDSSNWTTVTNATIDDVGIGEPSAPYSARFNGNPSGNDRIESKVIDLASYSQATLSYYFEQAGGGDDPESGDDLIVEYWDGAGWIELERKLGAATAATSYTQSSISLPSAAFHTGFRLAFRSVGTSGALDDWFVDDVSLVVDSGSGASSEGFETGDFSKFPWTHPDAIDWTVTTTTPHAGRYAAKSGAITHSGLTTLQVTQTTGAGNITFWRKVSSEASFDYLRFYIDGVQQGTGWSGELAWANKPSRSPPARTPSSGRTARMPA